MKEYIVTLTIVMKVKAETEYEAQQSAIVELADEVGAMTTKLCRVIPIVDKRCLV